MHIMLIIIPAICPISKGGSFSQNLIKIKHSKVKWLEIFVQT